MPKPRGITVTLYEKASASVDAFNNPVYTETAVTVDNVLISPTDGVGEELLDTLNLNGRVGHYTLAVPKGDNHTWEGNRVEFFGRSWNVIGMPVQGIESMIPLGWNKKVKVEAIE